LQNNRREKNIIKYFRLIFFNNLASFREITNSYLFLLSIIALLVIIAFGKIEMNNSFILICISFFSPVTIHSLTKGVNPELLSSFPTDIGQIIKILFYRYVSTFIMFSLIVIIAGSIIYKINLLLIVTVVGSVLSFNYLMYVVFGIIIYKNLGITTIGIFTMFLFNISLSTVLFLLVKYGFIVDIIVFLLFYNVLYHALFSKIINKIIYQNSDQIWDKIYGSDSN
jgi:hypothetical protein